MNRDKITVGMEVTFNPQILRARGSQNIRLRGWIRCIPADAEEPIEIQPPGGAPAYRFPIDIEPLGTAARKEAGT